MALRVNPKDWYFYGYVLKEKSEGTGVRAFRGTGIARNGHNYYGASGDPAMFKVEANGEGLYVVITYNPRMNCRSWSVGIMPFENQQLPNWPMSWGQKDASTRLILELPEDAKVKAI